MRDRVGHLAVLRWSEDGRFVEDFLTDGVDGESIELPQRPKLVERHDLCGSASCVRSSPVDARSSGSMNSLSRRRPSRRFSECAGGAFSVLRRSSGRTLTPCNPKRIDINRALRCTR